MELKKMEKDPTNQSDGIFWGMKFMERWVKVEEVMCY